MAKRGAAPMNDAMGEKAKRLPPRPRLYLNGFEILPLMDDEWHPVKDKWVLPGCGVLTTDEIRTRAAAGDMTVSIITA